MIIRPIRREVVSFESPWKQMSDKQMSELANIIRSWIAQF